MRHRDSMKVLHAQLKGCDGVWVGTKVYLHERSTSSLLTEASLWEVSKELGKAFSY